MSGILGIFYRDERPVLASELQAMSTTIAHRGQDDEGIWHSGSVGLGHRMLWTTPESLNEKLPTFQTSKQLAITADVRLDNRPELISQLDLRYDSPQTLTDSELILAAYERWGQACPEYLLGDFAFAIWDESTRQLFCARDRFGVKPFYFFSSSGTFAFASEIKALFALEGVPRQLNETRVADYFSLTLNDPEITSFKNIWRLPSAHSLTVSAQKSPHQHQYWILDRTREIHHNSDQAYTEEFLHHFTEAVRCRIRSPFAVGSHLSGGLDSSSIACMAQQIRQQTQGDPIHTLSHIYPDVPESDESEFMDIVLKQGDFISHRVRGDLSGPLTAWKSFFKYLDESLLGNGYLNWMINRLAKENNVRILLSGFDGDTVVGHGFNYLAEAARDLQWQTVVNEATQFAERYNRPDTSASYLIQRYSLPTLKDLVHSGKWLEFARAVNQLSPASKVSRRRFWYECGLKEMGGVRQFRNWRAKQRAQKIPSSNPYPLLNADFLAQLNFQQRVETLNPYQSPPQTVKESQWRALTSGLFVLPLEAVDIFSAAFGIETRHPFLDTRLVEYCLAIPPQQKLNQGWSRMILRRAMEGILPKDIQWRSTKGDSTALFFHGVHQYDKELLDKLVNDDCQRLTKYINFPHVKNSYEKTLKDTEQDISGLWFVITFALWLRCQNGLK
jgi:asparagine synthase (glutamine-hydrolysing)